MKVAFLKKQNFIEHSAVGEKRSTLDRGKGHQTRCHSYYVKRIFYTNKERDSSKGIAFAFSCGCALTCSALCTASILHYLLH